MRVPWQFNRYPDARCHRAIKHHRRISNCSIVFIVLACFESGHEGVGSLLSRLKALGLATDLSAGVSNSGQEQSSAAWIFSVSVTLTPRGHAEWERVVDTLFCFINLVRCSGPQPYLWDELKTIAEIEFRFQVPLLHTLLQKKSVV